MVPESFPAQLPVPDALARPPRGKVAVLAPHPDDEVVGPGGCVAIHRALGDPVRALIVTDGRAGNVGGGDWREHVAVRRAESRAAAELLGGYPITFWDFPDNCVITEEAVAEVTHRAVEWFRADPPDIVYAPAPMDAHSDHAAIAEIARRALAQIGFTGIHYGYEVWGMAPVDTVVAIDDVAERKLAAMRCFPSQLAYTSFDHFVMGMNAARALFLPKGGRYAEGFVTSRIGGGRR